MEKHRIRLIQSLVIQNARISRDVQALHVARLRIILSRVRCLVASPVQATLTRSKSELFTPYPGLSQPRRELPLATIEAGCIIPEGGIMTCVLHHLDLRMSYGSFVLVNH